MQELMRRPISPSTDGFAHAVGAVLARAAGAHSPTSVEVWPRRSGPGIGLIGAGIAIRSGEEMACR